MRALGAALAAAFLLAPAAHAQPAPLPAGWPSATLQLGMRDDEGGADALRRTTRLTIRYHYLSGGVNTGRGWTTWTMGGGSFVPGFIADSADHGFLPVFSYYQLRESLPGASMPEERGMLTNLANTDTMRAYFQDLKLFFQKAGASGHTVVFHVEPDAWGYIERNTRGGDPATVPVRVAATGLPELAGLPDDASGFARAIVRLRDRYAPNVLLGYHLSVWGTGEDIADSDPSDAHVDELAAKASAYYAALKAPFDLIFAESTNSDAGYRQYHDGDGGRSWWTPEDFGRQVRFLGDVSSTTGKRIVLWQLPLGNQRMLAMNNTYGHYQDNHVEWLLGGAAARAHQQAYADAGVIAFLFGPALPGATCACDALGDGVTNPAAIGANTTPSLSADDDGGLFRSLANTYYGGTPVALPAAHVTGGPKAKPRRTAPRLTVRARTSARARRGSPVQVRVVVTASSVARAVVAVQFYAPGATTPTGQVAYRGQRLSGGKPSRYTATYTVGRRARPGRWEVKIGVFDPDFKKLWHWAPRAAFFTVR